MPNNRHIFQPGDLINNQYWIVRPLSHGGMGAVYLATDLKLDRQVAIKTLFDMLSPAQRRRRPLKEARAGKSHRNVVAFYDVVKDSQRDMTCIVMEYVDGKVLGDLLVPGTSWEPDRAVSVLKQIAAALDHLHREGVTHCDLKPTNLMIDNSDHVTLIDFGLARSLDDSNPLAGGTPRYMSPQQVAGEDFDEQTDQFSLAIIAYQMLTGLLPFDGSSPDAIRAEVRRAQPTPPCQVDRQLAHDVDRVVLKALNRAPIDRYRSCAAFIEDLDKAVRGIVTPPPPDPRPWIAALIAVLAASLAVWFFWQPQFDLAVYRGAAKILPGERVQAAEFDQVTVKATVDHQPPWAHQALGVRVLNDGVQIDKAGVKSGEARPFPLPLRGGSYTVELTSDGKVVKSLSFSIELPVPPPPPCGAECEPKIEVSIGSRQIKDGETVYGTFAPGDLKAQAVPAPPDGALHLTWVFQKRTGKVDIRPAVIGSDGQPQPNPAAPTPGKYTVRARVGDKDLPEFHFEIRVPRVWVSAFSRSERIPRGLTFSLNDDRYGNLKDGELSAVIGSDAGSPSGSEAHVEWLLGDQPLPPPAVPGDRRFPGIPTPGRYTVRLVVAGAPAPVDEFRFGIAPPPPIACEVLLYVRGKQVPNEADLPLRDHNELLPGDLEIEPSKNCHLRPVAPSMITWHVVDMAGGTVPTGANACSMPVLAGKKTAFGCPVAVGRYEGILATPEANARVAFSIIDARKPFDCLELKVYSEADKRTPFEIVDHQSFTEDDERYGNLVSGDLVVSVGNSCESRLPSNAAVRVLWVRDDAVAGNGLLAAGELGIRTTQKFKSPPRPGSYIVRLTVDGLPGAPVSFSILPKGK